MRDAHEDRVFEHSGRGANFISGCGPAVAVECRTVGDPGERVLEVGRSDVHHRYVRARAVRDRDLVQMLALNWTKALQAPDGRYHDGRARGQGETDDGHDDLDGVTAAMGPWRRPIVCPSRTCGHKHERTNGWRVPKFAAGHAPGARCFWCLRRPFPGPRKDVMSATHADAR